MAAFDLWVAGAMSGIVAFLAKLQAAGTQIASTNSQLQARQHKSTARRPRCFPVRLAYRLILPWLISPKSLTFAVLKVFFNPTQLISINYVR
jgi:hypothetical protein